jgi:cytochrome c556
MQRSRILWAAVAGSALAVAVAGVAVSAGNPVADRQAVMKAVGQAMKDGAGFATGQTAWDAGKVKAAMDGVAANSRKAKALFPAGSGADPKSSADPKVWTAKADFDKRMTEMATLATAAGQAKDTASFKTRFQALSATCKSCHDIYRKKKT